MVMIAEQSTVNVKIDPSDGGGFDVALEVAGVMLSFHLPRDGAERIVSMLTSALAVDAVDPQGPVPKADA
jgi:hypothetical protein